jgi:hypothetical protein
MRKKIQVVLIFALSILASIDAATQFSVPGGEVVSCTDDISNVCTAPTSCNKNGRANFVSGKNFNIGKTTQQDGYWYIVGGYNMSFSSDCDIICQGNCTCEKCSNSTQVTDFVTADTPGAQSLQENLPSSSNMIGATGLFLVWATMTYFVH